MKQVGVREVKSAARASAERESGTRGTAVLDPPRYGIDLIDRARDDAREDAIDPREVVALALAPAVRVSSPSDAREREADRMADAVMRMPEPMAAGLPVQRRADETAEHGVERLVERSVEDEEPDELERFAEPGAAGEAAGEVASSVEPPPEPKLEPKPAPEPEPAPAPEPKHDGLGQRAGTDQPEKPRPPIDEAPAEQVAAEPPADEVARKAEPSRAPRSRTPTATRTQLRTVTGSGGAPLPGRVLQFMESRFGDRFRSVRVHTGAAAGALAQALSARAFTWGSNIVFAPGHFAPTTDEGRRLLAHELGHVIQNRRGGAAVLHRKAEPESKPKQAPSSPQTPEQDPEFGALRARVANRSASQARHGRGPDKAVAGARAAQVKPAELRGQGQRTRIADMAGKAEKPPAFDESAFARELFAEVERIAPKNEAEVLELDKSGKAREFEQVKDGVGKSVGEAQAKVQGPLATASKQPPAAAKPDRQVSPLQPEGTGPTPGSVRADRAMPPPRTRAEMDLEPLAAEAEAPLIESPTTKQLVSELPDDPTLGEAGRATAELRTETEAAPERYREREAGVLSSARGEASTDAGKLLGGMVDRRGAVFGQVATDQRAVKTDSERRREDASKNIDTIFADTKSKLDKRLARLEQEVGDRFSREADAALAAFREFIDKEAKKYQKTWLETAVDTVVEVFVGPLPKPIHDFYDKGRKQFLARMRRVIGGIGTLVETGLAEAKAIVAEGRRQVDEVLAGLGDDLDEFKRSKAAEIDLRFTGLEDQIAARRRSLVGDLAKRYVAAVEKMKAIETEVRDAHKNVLEHARDALIAAKDYVLGQLQRLAEYVGDAAGAILRDPGRFLSNMARGIIGGFELFAANIGQNIKTAVVEWITGNLGAAGIQLPTTWDAKGTIGFILELVGLGMSNVMAIARQVFGARVISAIERGVAGFEKIREIFDILRKDGVAGLWAYLRQEFLAYKDKLLGEAGEALAQGLVVAGVKKAVGLLSGLATGGLGTLITIVSMIIDTVTWVVNNGPRLVALIKTVTGMIQDVMSGRVEAIAKAVNGVLERLLPVVLGFVGALVGIDPVIAKIQKIFRAIREPATKLITKLFTKIRDALKSVIDKIVRTGSAAAKRTVGALVGWWKKIRKFKTDEGDSHTLYFQGSPDKAEIWVASNDPSQVHRYLEWVRGGAVDQLGGRRRDPEAAKIGAAIRKSAEIKAAVGKAKTDQLAVAKAQRDAQKAKTDADKRRTTKQLEAAMAKLGTSLGKLMSLVDKALGGKAAQTRFGFAGTNAAGFGTGAVAFPLTNFRPRGSTPKQSLTTPAWAVLRDRIVVTGTYYVLGHLLNHNLGGTGSSWDNLTPLSRPGNSQHEKQAESAVKSTAEGLARNQAIFYSVRPTYGRRGVPLATKLGKQARTSKHEKRVLELLEAEKKVPTGLKIVAKLYTIAVGKQFPTTAPVPGAAPPGRGSTYASVSDIPGTAGNIDNDIESLTDPRDYKLR